MSGLYDYKALGLLVRCEINRRGMGYRAAADEMGIDIASVSRLTSGRSVAADKVFAMAEWVSVNPDKFYCGKITPSRIAEKRAARGCFTDVSRAERFHVKASETDDAWLQDRGRY